MSIEPVVTGANTGGSFNRYVYANNNPYKYIDPDGRAVETPWDAANVARAAENPETPSTAFQTKIRLVIDIWKKERNYKMVTQSIKIGQLVEIDLGNKHRAFGRVISKAELAFYDCCISTDALLDLDSIYRAPVAFTLSVMNNAVKSGRWKVIDCRPIEPMFNKERFYFMRDVLTEKISIYNATSGETLPAKPGDGAGLERAAVWEAEHVEDRLRDHFSGVKNQWVEQLR